MCVRVCTRMCACVRVCAHVRACVCPCAIEAHTSSQNLLISKLMLSVHCTNVNTREESWCVGTK